MQSEKPASVVAIRFTPEFKRNLRALGKRYHIYSKSEQSDISAAEVRRIIHEFEESRT